MSTKVLVKMQNHERSLETLMAAVRESAYQVRNLNARLSLDETIFFLTLEVAGDEPLKTLSANLSSIEGVKSVEMNP